MAYIDRDKLMAELEREVDLADHWKTAHEMANVVKYFPTADVVERKDIEAELDAAYKHGYSDCFSERKKGRWINDRGLYRCSSCNQLWTEWWTASKPIERMKKEAPYCPMCGSYNGEETTQANDSNALNVLDCVSRQAAIDACHNYDDGKDAYAYGFVVEERLQGLPSAQPERKKGKWERHSIGHENTPWGFDCSTCGKWFVIGEDTAEQYHFCPNCGAEMERSEE